MTTIALCGWPLPGAINGVVMLARRLRERGHQVWIISIPDAAPVVAEAGLMFEPVLAEMFPTGFLVNLRKQFAELGPFALLRERRRWTSRYEKLIGDVLAGRNREVDEALDRIAPQLVLLSPDVPHLALIGLLARRRGIPMAYATSLFSHYPHPVNPPLSSLHVPTHSPLGAWHVRLIWARHHIVGRIRHAAITWLGLDINMLRFLSPLARLTGQRRLSWRSFLAPLAVAPEFFLSAEELDFPAPLPPRRHRIGFAINPDRTESDFPWDRIDPTRKLLYCSLGTLLYLPLQRHRELLQAMIDAAAELPGWQLVMATGSYVHPDELTGYPAGAIVMSRVPQLQILQRAALMITHAGANSVHECVYFGVPSVLLPIAFDQPGCAARMVYHGLGVLGDPRRATAADIRRLIETAAAPEFALRCTEMSARIRQPTYTEAGFAALEALAGE
ncbi:nucleotide disphospho-sugar-binding domain-containing protein [Dyella subtropica]|uniref:nucleotide disphospho-sugar-binding domain-containing protein n=1 Tax=Dyella subtropica TaxID=2992127 RepID=UPI0022594C18|nr:glycosyltransferase [Dyella subtropica]